MRGNILQQIPAFTPDMLTVPEQPRNNAIQSPKTERVSALNVLGEMADWVAGVGGAEPMYRPTLDAREDRARQAEADQMAREEFGLKKDKFGLEKQKYGLEIADAQREALGKAYIGVKSLYDRYGADGVRKAAPRLQQLFGLSPEQTQMVADNPEEALMLLQGLAESGADTKFGVGAPVKLINRQTGEVVLLQPSSSGGFRQEAIPPGFEIAEPLQFENLNDRVDIRNRQTGAQVQPPLQKGGTPSADQRPDGQGGMEATPNSTLDLERKAAKDKAEARAVAARQQASIVKNSIARAKALAAKNWTTGLVGPYAAMIGGTDARDLQEATKTILANTTVENLMEMRQNSPTGAAVGNPSDKDMALLGSLRGSLDQAQSKEQFLQILGEMEVLTDRIINPPAPKGKGGAPASTGWKIERID